MRNRIVASLLLGFITLNVTPASTAVPQHNSHRDAKMSVNPAGIETSTPVYLAQRQLGTSLEGTWTITEGKNPNGSKYSGTLDIQATDDLYTLAWNTSEQTYSGLGFLEDDHLFVGWGPVDQVYGVALYRINDDGTLDGKWTFSGGDGKVGKETATGGRRGKVEGSYQISGTDSEGSYTGSLNIRKSDDTYEITWTVDNQTYRGVGLRSDDWLVVGWGPKNKFGVFDYKIDGDRAKGRWAFLGDSDLGSEKISRVQGSTQGR